MTTHRRKLLPFCIAAALLSGSAAAVGLGDIQLTSYLGKPLQAEVALNNLGDLSADQLKIKIGSEADYQALGVEHSYLHTLLKIEPFVRDGHGYVRISTREPISEPYLNFVLNVQWPQGRVVREFTVLLDPAPMTAAVATVQPERIRSREATSAGVEAPSPAPRARRLAQTRSSPESSSPEQTQSPAPMPSSGDYTVQRGDSLWRIAARLRLPKAALPQVMSAIVAQNPHAFVNGDPDRIKEAARIVMPGAEQIAAATGALPATATATVAESAAPARSHTADTKTADAKADSSIAVVPAELVEENSVLKAQVTALTSNVDGLNHNLEQSEQRLHQLESQLDTLLQQMQQQRTTLAALSGATVAATGSVAPATGSMINQVNAGELHAAPVAHTPWWVHLLYWLGIGGAAMWAIREHFWPQRRFAAIAADDSGGLDGSAPLLARAMPEPVDHSWRTAARHQPLPMLDEGLDQVLENFELDESSLPVEAIEASAVGTAPPALGGMAEDAIVDVSISAGVFLAFGRYDEAERLLRDALQRAPERIELKLQLLDVHLQADQPEQFEALAEEIEQEADSAEVQAELAVLRESYRARGH